MLIVLIWRYSWQVEGMLRKEFLVWQSQWISITGKGPVAPHPMYLEFVPQPKFQANLSVRQVVRLEFPWLSLIHHFGRLACWKVPSCSRYLRTSPSSHGIESFRDVGNSHAAQLAAYICGPILVKDYTHTTYWSMIGYMFNPIIF